MKRYISFKKCLAAGITASLLVGLLAGVGFTAEEWPTRAIRIICPWAAGGGTDRISRKIAEVGKKYFGVPIIVENRTGGTGAVGHTYGAEAKPDGYVVTHATFELVSAPAMGLVKITYKDFEPVIRLNVDPDAISVRADAPWKTLDDLIKEAEEKPGVITIANSGPGTCWHIGACRFQDVAGVKFVHVPFDGAFQEIQALMGGHVAAISCSPAEVAPYIESGDLRCLTVLAEERTYLLPDVPTAKELGYPAMLGGTWRGLAVPKGTPKEIVDKLVDGFTKAWNDPEFQDFMKKQGFGLAYLGPEEWGKFLESEHSAVGAVLKAVGLAR